MRRQALQIHQVSTYSGSTGTSQLARTKQEELEQLGLPKGDMGRVQIVLALVHSPCKLRRQDDEQGHAGHLQTETSQHDVHAGLEILLGVRSAREGTTGGLEDETEDVASDEGEGVGARPEAGDMLAVDDDDAAEAEIDGRREESGRDRKGDDVPESLHQSCDT